MRQKTRGLIAAIFASMAFLASQQSFAQRDFSNIQIEVITVAHNVYMLQGAGGNIGVSVGTDGLLIIDDQFAPLADKIKTALASLNKGDLQYVLNTHVHGDHVGGNAIFGQQARIIAHQNVRRNMLDNNTELAALPVITFDHQLSIHFNGEEITASHFPNAHTDGDSVIWFKNANVVHMGDLFFAGRFPYIDLKRGGSVMGLMSSVKQILQSIQADTKIIPGHGALSSADDLRHYVEMLQTTISHVQSAAKSGKTLSEIQTQGLAKKWQGWGSGFITESRWIDIIYKSTVK